MAFVAVDKNGEEYIYENKPIKSIIDKNFCVERYSGDWFILLPSGTIKKLIGRDLTFDDDPVELT